MKEEYLKFRLIKMFLNTPEQSHIKWLIRQELSTMDTRMG